MNVRASSSSFADDLHVYGPAIELGTYGPTPASPDAAGASKMNGGVPRYARANSWSSTSAGGGPSRRNKAHALAFLHQNEDEDDADEDGPVYDVDPFNDSRYENALQPAAAAEEEDDEFGANAREGRMRLMFQPITKTEATWMTTSAVAVAGLVSTLIVILVVG